MPKFIIGSYWWLPPVAPKTQPQRGPSILRFIVNSDTSKLEAIELGILPTANDAELTWQAQPQLMQNQPVGLFVYDPKVNAHFYFIIDQTNLYRFNYAVNTKLIQNNFPTQLRINKLKNGDLSQQYQYIRLGEKHLAQVLAKKFDVKNHSPLETDKIPTEYFIFFDLSRNLELNDLVKKIKTNLTPKQQFEITTLLESTWEDLKQKTTQETYGPTLIAIAEGENLTELDIEIYSQAKLLRDFLIPNVLDTRLNPIRFYQGDDRTREDQPKLIDVYNFIFSLIKEELLAIGYEGSLRDSFSKFPSTLKNMETYRVGKYPKDEQHLASYRLLSERKHHILSDLYRMSFLSTIDLDEQQIEAQLCIVNALLNPNSIECNQINGLDILSEYAAIQSADLNITQQEASERINKELTELKSKLEKSRWEKYKDWIKEKARWEKYKNWIKEKNIAALSVNLQNKDQVKILIELLEKDAISLLIPFLQLIAENKNSFAYLNCTKEDTFFSLKIIMRLMVPENLRYVLLELYGFEKLLDNVIEDFDYLIKCLQWLPLTKRTDLILSLSKTALKDKKLLLLNDSQTTHAFLPNLPEDCREMFFNYDLQIIPVGSIYLYNALFKKITMQDRVAFINKLAPHILNRALGWGGDNFHEIINLFYHENNYQPCLAGPQEAINKIIQSANGNYLKEALINRIYPRFNYSYELQNINQQLRIILIALCKRGDNLECLSNIIEYLNDSSCLDVNKDIRRRREIKSLIANINIASHISGKEYACFLNKFYVRRPNLFSDYAETFFSELITMPGKEMDLFLNHVNSTVLQELTTPPVGSLYELLKDGNLNNKQQDILFEKLQENPHFYNFYNFYPHSPSLFNSHIRDTISSIVLPSSENYLKNKAYLRDLLITYRLQRSLNPDHYYSLFGIGRFFGGHSKDAKIAGSYILEEAIRNNNFDTLKRLPRELRACITQGTLGLITAAFERLEGDYYHQLNENNQLRAVRYNS